MLNRYGLICGIFILTICFIYGERSPLQYSKVQIHVTSPEDVKHIQQAGLGLDHYKVIEESIETILDDRQIEILKATGISYEILIDNVIENYNQFIRIPDAAMSQLQQEMRDEYGVEGFEFGSMGGYYTFSEVVTELDSMRLLYPDLITVKQSIGPSVDSLDIWMVKISDNPDTDEEEPEILYTSLIHAREPQSMATVIYFMYYLLENYEVDPFVTFLIDNRELYFVPVINPDGYLYNEQTNPNGGGMWYKNNRYNGDGTWGVNNNNNFGYMWGYDNIGSSAITSDSDYRGTGPFSEPETQAIRDFCLDRNFKLAINYHTPMNHLFLPWGYIYNAHTPDSSVFVDLAIEMTQHNNYTYSVSTNSLGVINGYSDDWMYGEQTEKDKIIAFTPEVGNTRWPSQTLIYPWAQENVYPNLILALGSGVLGIDTTFQVEYATSSAGYLSPGIDSVFIQAGITNTDNLPVSINTFIEDFDHTTIDTVLLFDDGSHYDNLAYDGIFGGVQLAPVDEKHYSAHLYMQSDSGYVNFLNDIGYFTTIGPVVFDEITLITDTIAEPGDYISFQFALENLGSNGIAESITATLSSDDSCFSTLSLTGSFGDIGPGESNVIIGGGGFRITDYCPGDVDLTILVDIYSNGYHFWTDSFSIHVYEPQVSAADIGLLPQEYSLAQNYPNPFNPITSIQYELPQNSDVQITIYDLMGREVTTLISESQDAGYKSIQWDATNVPSGMYFYQIKAGEFVQTKKMILLK